MFKFLKLKSSQGPWGPWSKGRENDAKNPPKESEQEEIIVPENLESKKNSDDENSVSNGGGSGNSNNNQDDKKDNNSKKEENSVKEDSSKAQSQNQPIRGPWGETGSKKEESSSNKYNKIVKDIIGNKGNFGGGSNNSGGDNDDGFFDKLLASPKKIGGLLVLGIFAFWLATGFYKVDSDENAIILYFGKFHGIATPGLNYHIPFPVGKIIKQKVASVNSEEFGAVSNSKRKSKFGDSENLMLTGDENIVDIEFQIQWQISNIEEFSFNIYEPKLAIRKAAQSAMREVIAKTPISDALSTGKNRIELEVKTLLQETLDSYNSGVRIVLVQLRRVDPPLQVIDSFRDVQTAKADREREINEAQAYANDIIPRARGNASEMEEGAEAYKNRVEADAQGEAQRFESLYYQYRKAKEVTRKRIYLKTMQKVYGDIDKVIIDKESSGGAVFPYFPLNDLHKKNEVKIENINSKQN